MNKHNSQGAKENRINKYLKDWIKKSLVSKILDIITLLLIILILIPSSRMYLKTQFTRLTMRPPSVTSGSGNNVLLQPADYRLSLIDNKGKKVTLENFKGQVIFLNFWATWCPPCVAEMPDLQDLYDQYKNKVEFFFISNEESSVTKQFMLKHNLNLPVYHLSGNRVPEAFHSNTIPATFVISQDGQIIISRKGAARWNSESVKNMLDALLTNQ